MTAVAPSSDQTADLLQNLSLDSQPKPIEASVPTKKNGPGFSTFPPNGAAKPFSPSAGYLPNGFLPHRYYYGAYDGQGNSWNDYSMYNADGPTAQSIYGDNCSYLLPQGYGFTPYGPYTPPTSPAPTMQHEGQLYGMQHYQYHSPYYQNHALTGGCCAPNEVGVSEGQFSTSVFADQLSLSYDISKASNNHTIHGEVVDEKNGLKSLVKSPQDSSLSDNQEKPCLPPCITLPGYPDLRGFSNGIECQTPLTNGSPFSTGQYRGAQAGALSSMAYGEDFPSWSNKNLHPPQYMNMQNTRPLPGLGLASGYMNEVFSGNRMYSRYGNPLRNGSSFASCGYGYPANDHGWSTDAKYKPVGFGNHAVSYGKVNFNSLNELNKGPRIKGSNHKNQTGVEPFPLLLKDQSLPASNDEKATSLIPNKEEFSGVGFADYCENAKFFVIKSYSEDDVHKSIKYGVWASTPNGNKKLNTAYLEAKKNIDACPIFLLFSVNASGQFVGISEMVGPVDFDKTVEYWQQDKWNGCFPVKWRIIKDVPNSLLKHITLKNNENKPVTSSRDTQEVKLEQGIEMIEIFKSHSSKTCILDDFEFYDSRQRTMQESKSKDREFRKKVVNVNDLDLASVKQSVIAETGAETDTVANGFGENEFANVVDESAVASELDAVCLVE